MSLRDTDTIDIIVKSPHTKGYDLIVTDGGDVTDEIERHTLLVEKLSTYANYVCDGDLKNDHPDADSTSFPFVAICANPANNAML